MKADCPDQLDSGASKPLVSLIIVNYNAGRLLVECVQSAAQQVDEILIVDNASKDASVEDCEQYFTGLEHPLKIIRNASNKGFSVACNLGYAEAKGDFLLFLNPDCQLDDAAVNRFIHVIRSDDSVGMVGGLLVNPDGTEQRGGRREIPTPMKSLIRLLGLSRYMFYFDLNNQPLPTCPIEAPAISGACMFVRREAVDDVGLWDEGYFLHCEDLDWCMRFQRKGWKIMFAPDAKVVHQKGACSKSRPIFVEWHKHKGMMRFYRKFFKDQYPGPLMWLVAIGVWLRFSVIALYYSIKRIPAFLGVQSGNS